MEQEDTANGTSRVAARDRAALKNRRTFLADAGKCGALLVGGTYLAETAGLETRASAQGAPPEGFDVNAEADRIRVFGIGQRAPGMLRVDIRRKTLIMWAGYASAALSEATGLPSGGARWFIQNFVNESAFGVEGQTQCLPFIERDFVAEFSLLQPTGPGRGGQAQAPRTPTFPSTAEAGTDLPFVARQVLAQGKRPLAETGREKGIHFLKLSANIARADQVKTWQALHDKAMASARVFASELAGYELLQRLANTRDRQMNRCGAEIPVPELAACFWSKSKRGAQEFPTYARAFLQADQQKAIDGPSSFLLMTEEWEVQQAVER